MCAYTLPCVECATTACTISQNVGTCRPRPADHQPLMTTAQHVNVHAIWAGGKVALFDSFLRVGSFFSPGFACICPRKRMHPANTQALGMTHPGRLQRCRSTTDDGGTRGIFLARGAWKYRSSASLVPSTSFQAVLPMVLGLVNVHHRHIETCHATRVVAALRMGHPRRTTGSACRQHHDVHHRSFDGPRWPSHLDGHCSLPHVSLAMMFFRAFF